MQPVLEESIQNKTRRALLLRMEHRVGFGRGPSAALDRDVRWVTTDRPTEDRPGRGGSDAPDGTGRSRGSLVVVDDDADAHNHRVLLFPGARGGEHLVGGLGVGGDIMEAGTTSSLHRVDSRTHIHEALHTIPGLHKRGLDLPLSRRLAFRRCRGWIRGGGLAVVTMVFVVATFVAQHRAVHRARDLPRPNAEVIHRGVDPRGGGSNPGGGGRLGTRREGEWVGPGALASTAPGVRQVEGMRDDVDAAVGAATEAYVSLLARDDAEGLDDSTYSDMVRGRGEVFGNRRNRDQPSSLPRVRGARVSRGGHVLARQKTRWAGGRGHHTRGEDGEGGEGEGGGDAAADGGETVVDGDAASAVEAETETEPAATTATPAAEGTLRGDLDLDGPSREAAADEAEPTPRGGAWGSGALSSVLSSASLSSSALSSIASSRYQRLRFSRWGAGASRKREEAWDEPEDGVSAVDDGTCGGVSVEGGLPERTGTRSRCWPHGFCRRGRCVCAAAYRGEGCDEATSLPFAIGDVDRKGAREGDPFDGDLIVSAASVRERGGINFTANPKVGAKFAGKPPERVFAPLLTDPANFTLNRRITALTADLLPHMPAADPLRGRVYESCAVVGNSGLTMVYDEGAAIDAHDAVIRFNAAPTKPRPGRAGAEGQRDVEADFSRHVGRRTTFRFVNTQHIPWHEGGELRLQQVQSMQGLWRYLEYKRAHPEARLLPFATDLTRHVSSSVPNLPTGGYFAVIFALQTCVRVSVYGFHWRPGHAIPHHYFNSEEPTRGKDMIHDYGREADNIRALAAAGLVTLRQPCVAGCEAESGVPCGAACSPGSACACGQGAPTPVALPGYCHARLNFTCFVKCPGGGAQCRGGPRHSRCPRAIGANGGGGLPCVTRGEMQDAGADGEPEWTRKGWSDPAEEERKGPRGGTGEVQAARKRSARLA